MFILSKRVVAPTAELTYMVAYIGFLQTRDGVVVITANDRSGIEGTTTLSTESARDWWRDRIAEGFGRDQAAETTLPKFLAAPGVA